MPTPTYTPLSKITLNQPAGAVTFSSIPGNFKDLSMVIVTYQIGTGSHTSLFRLNGDVGLNYNEVTMYSSASTLISFKSDGEDSGILTGHTNSTGTGSASIVDFFDYSATNKHKLVLQKGGAVGPTVFSVHTRWASASAINSIQVYANFGGNYQSGSTFTLYGIEG
jgi:hypothetical protein